LKCLPTLSRFIKLQIVYALFADDWNYIPAIFEKSLDTNWFCGAGLSIAVNVDRNTKKYYSQNGGDDILISEHLDILYCTINILANLELRYVFRLGENDLSLAIYSQYGFF